MPNPEAVPELSASSLRQVIGALVFSAEAPLPVESIRKCLRDRAAEADGAAAPFADVLPRDIRDALEDIARDLDRLDLGIELREVAGGFRFQTQPGCGRWVRSLLKRERPSRLSRSALETLAIIAYRQPIAKSELEGIRGVTVDHIVKALMEMHLVRITGRSDLPGRPFLYGTTPSFLEHFGLKSLDELNELDPTLQRGTPGTPGRKPRAKPAPAAAATAEAAADIPAAPAVGAADELATLAGPEGQAAIQAAQVSDPVFDPPPDRAGGDA
jgi:segregation and condensation protein B